MEQASYHADAYLRTLETRVSSCDASGSEFDVVLEDTLLRPEGGGQPSDAGQVGGHPVLRLGKLPSGAIVHRLPAPVAGRVRVELDWARRFDHMQQHTAQHLLTALAQRDLGWRTTAFHLGVEHSDLEFDVPALSADGLTRLLAQTNAAVRAARPVTGRWVDAAEYEALEVRSRLLPEGFDGPYRLVDIQGLDLNTCGGTHVANTAEVQAVAFAGTEPLRGGTRLFYLAGGRVLDGLERRLTRERDLNRILSCGPDDHAAAVERLQLGQRRAMQRIKTLSADLAQRLGQELATGPGPGLLHEPDGDMAFLLGVARAMLTADPDALALLTAGKAEGVFVLAGPEAQVAVLGPRVADLLGGRGGGTGGLFQGKARELGSRERALALLSEAD